MNKISIFNTETIGNIKFIRGNSDYQNAVVHRVPESLLETKNSDKEINGCIDETMKKILKTFVNVLNTKLSHITTHGYFANSRNLEIVNESSHKLSEYLMAKSFSAYIMFENLDGSVKPKIVLLNDAIEESIYHELLHMSSSYAKGTFQFVGFSQSKDGDKNFSIGRGLNEGYTDLLTRRYFSDQGAITNGYVIVMHIAELLEKVIGKEKMETLYFSADLYSLLDEIKSILGESKTILLLQNLDLLETLYYKKYKTIKINRVYRDVLLDISNLVIAKIDALIKENKIEEANKILIETIPLFCKDFKLNLGTCSGLSDEDILELFGNYSVIKKSRELKK